MQCVRKSKYRYEWCEHVSDITLCKLMCFLLSVFFWVSCNQTIERMNGKWKIRLIDSVYNFIQCYISLYYITYLPIKIESMFFPSFFVHCNIELCFCICVAPILHISFGAFHRSTWFHRTPLFSGVFRVAFRFCYLFTYPQRKLWKFHTTLRRYGFARPNANAFCHANEIWKIKVNV